MRKSRRSSDKGSPSRRCHSSCSVSPRDDIQPAANPPLPNAPPPRQPPPPAEDAPTGSLAGTQPNALPLDIDDVVRKMAAALYPYMGPSDARDPIPDPPVSEDSYSEEEDEVEDVTSLECRANGDLRPDAPFQRDFTPRL